MKKIIIGVSAACFTAGIVLAGCGAGTSEPVETTSEVPLAETIAETTTTTAETTTTTEETTTSEDTTTSTEATTAVANAHPEDDAFMAYLRILYHKDTLDGVPYADRNYKCKYFAIADFDADGENELMIEHGYTWADGNEIVSLNMYEANSLGGNFDDNSVFWIPDKPFTDVTFLDNGVAYSIDENNNINILDSKRYYLISDDMPSKLKYNMSLADFESKARILYYYENAGKILKTLGSQQAPLFEDIEKTQAEYEEEKAILNNGNVMDVVAKECTAENIGIIGETYDLNELVEKAEAYYKSVKGHDPYNADLYNSGSPGEGIYIVIMDDEGAVFGDYIIDKTSGIGIDINTGEVVDFSKY